MELLFWIDAFKRASATQVTAVIPFFSYAKGDKKDEPRVSIRARVLRRLHRGGRRRPRADDGPAQPADPGVLQDPGRPPLRHARARRLLPREGDPRPGRRLARRRLRQAGVPVRRADAAAPVVFGNKVRRGHDEHGRDARHRRRRRGQERPDRRRLHDLGRDPDRDGHRLQGARGCRDVYACVSHGVFSKGSAAKIARSPIKELVFTDTIDYRFEPLAPCCKVISVASLFADAIMSIHRRESVSRLFNY